jgi:hypothetical protein
MHIRRAIACCNGYPGQRSPAGRKAAKKGGIGGNMAEERTTREELLRNAKKIYEEFCGKTVIGDDAQKVMTVTAIARFLERDRNGINL